MVMDAGRREKGRNRDTIGSHQAIAEDDEAAGDAVIEQVLIEVDTSLQRARLARGVIALRDAGRLRVLKLVESGCVQEFWKQSGPSSPEGSGAASETWVLDERVALKRDGVPLPFIPFVFHGPRNSRPEPDRLPLADIIAANLDHYRLDADYKHGLHFAALPTAWVSGFDKATPLRIGS
jgi:hypothetical protein